MVCMVWPDANLERRKRLGSASMRVRARIYTLTDSAVGFRVRVLVRALRLTVCVRLRTGRGYGEERDPITCVSEGGREGMSGRKHMTLFLTGAAVTNEAVYVEIVEPEA